MAVKIKKPERYFYHTEFETRDYELDAEGIVNNANYLHYLEYVRHCFCRDHGITFGEMRARGIVAVLRKVEIEYHHWLGGCEKITGALNIRREGAKFIFEQAIFDAEGRLSAAAEVTVVSVENGRLSRGDSLGEIFKTSLAACNRTPFCE